MGRRLVKEVISVIEPNPCIRKISFVAHSLGGLVSRYAIALLYETNDLKIIPTGNGEQFPILCGLRKLEKVACHASWLIGRTGRHLYLTDSDNGKPPFLLQMSNDYEDLLFISALQSFNRRVVYANVHFDKVVGWCTSSIWHPSELPKRNQFSRHERFKHVANVEPAKPSNPQNIHPQESVIDGWKNFNSEEMMEAMLLGLTKLSWERVDVKFTGIKQ